MGRGSRGAARSRAPGRRCSRRRTGPGSGTSPCAVARANAGTRSPAPGVNVCVYSGPPGGDDERGGGDGAAAADDRRHGQGHGRGDRHRQLGQVAARRRQRRCRDHPRLGDPRAPRRGDAGRRLRPRGLVPARDRLPDPPPARLPRGAGRHGARQPLRPRRLGPQPHHRAAVRPARRRARGRRHPRHHRRGAPGRRRGARPRRPAARPPAVQAGLLRRRRRPARPRHRRHRPARGRSRADHLGRPAPPSRATATPTPTAARPPPAAAGSPADHAAQMLDIDRARCDLGFNPQAYWDETLAMGVDTYAGGTMSAGDHGGSAITDVAASTQLGGRGSESLDDADGPRQPVRRRGGRRPVHRRPRRCLRSRVRRLPRLGPQHRRGRHARPRRTHHERGRLHHPGPHHGPHLAVDLAGDGRPRRLRAPRRGARHRPRGRGAVPDGRRRHGRRLRAGDAVPPGHRRPLHEVRLRRRHLRDHRARDAAVRRHVAGVPPRGPQLLRDPRGRGPADAGLHRRQRPLPPPLRPLHRRGRRHRRLVHHRRGVRGDGRPEVRRLRRRG